ncbi:protein delta homolog 1-like [Procambarus clarkii]|uniref:protein delta homolog 1-like n=1 Tax=Procambarus clarkii TaxID=6728 RepID=UPI00374240E1
MRSIIFLSAIVMLTAAAGVRNIVFMSNEGKHGSNENLLHGCGTGMLKPKCVCPKGKAFNGKTCIPDLCVSNPCDPGTCVGTGTSSSCCCPSGYMTTGTKCVTDPCANVTCSPGVCVVDPKGIARCYCPAGYIDSEGTC